jgi:hypothetical protein
MTLIASSFLAGSILSLLIPTLLLTALIIWYVKFIQRVPDTTEGEKAAGATPNPGPTAASASAPNPGPAAAPGGTPPPERRHTP